MVTRYELFRKSRAMDSTSLGQVALHNRVCLSGRICRDVSADLRASMHVEGSSARHVLQQSLRVGAGPREQEHTSLH